MTDAEGTSSAGAAAPPVIPLDREQFKQFMASVAVLAESYGKEKQKDKKPQIKKKKESNKKLEALKKKAAEDKSRFERHKKELKKEQLLAKKEKAVKRVEIRKSLIQKDQELIRSVNEKLGLPNNE